MMSSTTDDIDKEIESILPYICPLILQQILRKKKFYEFEGVLLLIDISGFTTLSLQVDVETFQELVNQYLSKQRNSFTISNIIHTNNSLIVK